MKFTYRDLVKKLKSKNLSTYAAQNLADDIISGKVGRDVFDRYGISASQVAAIQAVVRKRRERDTIAARLYAKAAEARKWADELDRMAREFETEE